MGKKKTVAEATTEAEIATTEIPIETPAAPESATATEETAPEPKSKKARKKKFEGVATLADLIDAPPVETIKAVLPRRRDFVKWLGERHGSCK